MKYWIEDDKGNLELRHWCDNPDCPAFSCRGGIGVISNLENDKEFCSMYCERQEYELTHRKEKK